MRLRAVANTESAYQTAVNKDGTGNASFVPGQIIEGKVTEVGKQVTLDFAGKQLNFPKESVPEAEKGQVRRFQVMQADRSGVVLKELGKGEQSTVAKAVFTQVNSPQHVASQEELVKEADSSEEDPEEIADRMTEEDYKALEEEGCTLENYNMGQLERALARIKAGREFKEQAVEGFREKTEQRRKEVRQIAARQIVAKQIAAGGWNGAIVEHLAEMMVKADIPVTKEKLQSILETAEYAMEAVGNGLGEAAKAYLIGNELPPEIDQIYKAVHSGNGKVQKLSEETWKELENSVGCVLEEAGLEMEEGSLADARWLLERELPLTAENLAYKAELDKLSEGIGEEEILPKAVEAVKEGKSAGNAMLARTPEELKTEAEVEARRRDFERIRPETVDAAVERLKAEGKDPETELSLSFLKRLQQELGSQAAGITIQDITTRRQLEEIRLKLTAEVGTRLLAQGIRLDTDGLSRIVEGLRNIEKEYYQKLYEEAGGAASDTDRVDLLQETSEAVSDLKDAPTSVLGVTFGRRLTENLQGMHEIGERLAEDFRRAGESYEALMTRPRADLGDSIQRAFRNVDSLLEGMGLEVTEANRRAVRILSYNNIELTQENLEEMKLYDARVNELLANMNPAACAALVKRGINPLEMPVAELNELLTRLREEGAQTEEKYSSYLVKLDQKKELSAEERESYIGIYRLLNQVTKTDGAALGAVVESGREITLASLLSAVRTRRKGGVDASVDDEFGGVQEIKQRGVSITDQVNAAFRYQQVLARQVLDTVTPERLDRAEEMAGRAAMDMSLESLKEALDEAAATAEAEEEAFGYAETKLQALKEAAVGSGQEQAFLAELGQEVSIAALQAAKELFSSRSAKDSLKALAEKYGIEAPEEEIDPEQMENAENMQEMVEEWTDLADKAISSLFEREGLTGEDSLRLLTLRNTVLLTKGLAKREFYEIPLRQESGFVKMNLTVVHTGSNTGSVSIRMKGETPEEGMPHGVMAYNATAYDTKDVAFDLQIEGKSLNCYISTASRPEMERLMQKEAVMKQSLMEQGFEITQWNYGLRTRSADSISFSGGNAYRAGQQGAAEPGAARTDDLYLAAKTIIKTAAAE